MPINKNDFLCYDFETGSADPHVCEPLQLAAVIIDCRNLEVRPDSEFRTYIKPTSWDNVQQEALAINKINPEVVERDGVSQKEAWEAFSRYANKYNKSKTPFGAPIAVGHNIIKFDNVISDRMCKLYGPVDKNNSPVLFNRRDVVDLMNMSFLWFENNAELENYKLDSLRTFFGIPLEGGHDALVDCKQTAMIVSRFLKYHRNISQKSNFRGAFV